MTLYRTFLTGILMCGTTMLMSCSKDNNKVIDTHTNKLVDAPTNPSKEKLLKLVNDTRAAGCNCGNTYYPPVNAVIWNNQLEAASKKHSEYMNSSGNFSHTGQNNTNAGDRITNEGYIWMSYGENIARGYATEEDVIQGWIKSEGHCKNIMNGNFTEMGIATSGSYWTQVFAKKQ
jgi:uncharacterized protein YkwD